MGRTQRHALVGLACAANGKVHDQDWQAHDLVGGWVGWREALVKLRFTGKNRKYRAGA